MSKITQVGTKRVCRGAVLGAAVLCASLGATALAQPEAQPVVLDRVVAVVNAQIILASDVENELRLAALEPEGPGGTQPTAQQALDELISRALIQQQIRQEDADASEPTPDQIQQRLTELRKELPACMRFNCVSDTGWKAFLNAHDLTEEQVDRYLHGRLEILTFIENRFRQGIRIEPQEIEDYYKNTLLPQYPQGQQAPKLENVSPRISEILLQQRVNAMFDAWLENLRKQGDIELVNSAASTISTGASR